MERHRVWSTSLGPSPLGILAAFGVTDKTPEAVDREWFWGQP